MPVQAGLGLGVQQQPVMSTDQIASTLQTLSDWNDRAPKLKAFAGATPQTISVTMTVQLPKPGIPNQTYGTDHTVVINAGDPEYAAILAAVQAAAARIVGSQQVNVNASLASAQTALNGGVAVATPVSVS